MIVNNLKSCDQAIRTLSVYSVLKRHVRFCLIASLIARVHLKVDSFV